MSSGNILHSTCWLYVWVDVLYVLYVWVDVLYVLYVWVDVLYVLYVWVDVQTFFFTTFCIFVGTIDKNMKQSLGEG